MASGAAAVARTARQGAGAGGRGGYGHSGPLAISWGVAPGVAAPPALGALPPVRPVGGLSRPGTGSTRTAHGLWALGRSPCGCPTSADSPVKAGGPGDRSAEEDPPAHLVWPGHIGPPLPPTWCQPQCTVTLWAKAGLSGHWRFLGRQGIPAWLHPAGTTRREVATKPGARCSLFVPWGVGTDRPPGVGAVPEELGREGVSTSSPGRAGFRSGFPSQPGAWARPPWGTGHC